MIPINSLSYFEHAKKALFLEKSPLQNPESVSRRTYLRFKQFPVTDSGKYHEKS